MSPQASSIPRRSCRQRSPTESQYLKLQRKHTANMQSLSEELNAEQGPQQIQQPVSPGESDSSSDSLQVFTPGSSPQDPLDTTELTEPSLFEEEPADKWLALPTIKDSNSTTLSTVHSTCLSKPSFTGNAAERNSDTALLQRCAEFIIKMNNLEAFLELPPGWVEERVAKMESTWRKQYFRDLDDARAKQKSQRVGS